MKRQCALDDVDGPDHAGAKAARRGEQNLERRFRHDAVDGEGPVALSSKRMNVDFGQASPLVARQVRHRGDGGRGGAFTTLLVEAAREPPDGKATEHRWNRMKAELRELIQNAYVGRSKEGLLEAMGITQRGAPSGCRNRQSARRGGSRFQAGARARLSRTDSDLDPIRNHPRYPKLLDLAGLGLPESIGRDRPN